MRDQVLARCQEKRFDELASFIRGTLEKRNELDLDGNRPHTREDFLAVWRILRKKSDSMASAVPSPSYTKLEKLLDKRQRTEDRLYNEIPSDPKMNRKKYVSQLEQTLKRLDREIEIEEMKEGRLHDYQPEPDFETEQQGSKQIASEIFVEIEDAFRHPTGRRLQWRPAQSGTLSVNNIGRYFEEQRRRSPEIQYDLDRIEKVKMLEPNDPPWEGPDGFDGYVIFTFPNTEKALMECPRIGHAAYVIHQDWTSWSQKNKQELMEEAEKGGKVTRIPHQGYGWAEKIRSALGFKSSASAS